MNCPRCGRELTPCRVCKGKGSYEAFDPEMEDEPVTLRCMACYDNPVRGYDQCAKCLTILQIKVLAFFAAGIVTCIIGFYLLFFT